MFIEREVPVRGRKGMGAHQSARMLKDEWLTPPPLLRALGAFCLDPCSPIERPWPTAARHYTVMDDGLSQPWQGRVWLNSPYGLEAAAWLKKLAAHQNGIALIFARTETKMFFEHVWNKADALLFLEGRLFFHLADAPHYERCLSAPHEWYVYNPATKAQACRWCGVAKANAGAPSVLVAYGKNNVEALKRSGLAGRVIDL